MRRLIYSPKVYVFIHSRTHDKVYDVSDYVTSGRVTRNINAPSKLEFSLKNRFFKFSANTKDKPMFLPMDGVTVWMQRIAGRPIQVFTGYLDSVPYMQLYPSDAPFTATCTLKRLELVRFDPGVQATMEFFSRRGWILGPDGTASNFEGLFKPLSQTNNQSTDGGLAVLLQDFMTEIAGWRNDTVLVSQVPRDLPARAAKLYNELQEDMQVQRDALEQFLKSLISLKANDMLGSTGAPAVDRVKAIIDIASQQGVDPWFIVMSALVLSGMDAEHAVEDPDAPDAGYGLFAMQAGIAAPEGGGPDIGGSAPVEDAIDAGGMRIEGYTVNEIMSPKNAIKAFIKRLRRERPGISLNQDFLKLSRDKVAEYIAQGAGKSGYKAQIQAAIETNADLVVSYMAAASGGVDGVPIIGSAINSVVLNERPFAYWQIDTASLDWNVTWDGVLEFMGAPPGTSEGPTPPVEPTPTAPSDNANSYTNRERRVLTTDNYKKLRKNYNRAAAYLYVGLQPGFDLVPLEVSNTGGETLLVMGRRQGDISAGGWGQSTRAPSVRAYYNWASSQTTSRGRIEVWYRNTDTRTSTSDILWTRNGRRQSTPPEVPLFSTDSTSSEVVIIRMTDNDNPIDPPYYNGHPIFSNNATTSEDETTEQPFKFSDLLSISFASAFTTRFSFPANFLESQILRGDRALMNDITVLEGVDQLCKASMRSYMSMPSGEFLAFFPDYFGGYGRPPYWKILDTEITNMGINLSDENLVTHAFVTGGTFVPGEVNFMNKALSLGVVSVEQVFNSDDFISAGAAWFVNGIDTDVLDALPITDSAVQGINRQAAIAGFLRTYGLRPMSMENPLIRSQVVEFLYAWQLFMYMWAAQFATRVSFTFQPELMVGGRVEFPDHDLQCYVEQVTHTWDYEGGFETDAVLMAPVATKKGRWPGMAMATGISGFGTINTGMGG